MEISISKEDLPEIENIIKNFTLKMKNTTISISALAFCLDSLIKAKEKLEKELNND